MAGQVRKDQSLLSLPPYRVSGIVVWEATTDTAAPNPRDWGPYVGWA